MMEHAVISGVGMTSSRIGLGTGITSVFVRTAPMIAMAAATVDDLSGGRFILGIGSSHKVQVEAEHGVAYSKPLTRTRETVTVIRALLRDGRVEYRGETVRIEGFDLWFMPRRPEIPIYVSAVFEKMTELCGEIADGVILTRSSLGTAAKVRQGLAVGAAISDRSGCPAPCANGAGQLFRWSFAGSVPKAKEAPAAASPQTVRRRTQIPRGQLSEPF